MLRHLRTRRRPRYGPHICALLAALLLLLSVSLLHSRLSFFLNNNNNNSQSLLQSQQSRRLPHHHSLPHDNNNNNLNSFNPLLDDLDSDPLSTSIDDRIDELDVDALFDSNNQNEEEEILAEEEDEDAVHSHTSAAASSSYFFDPLTAVVRRSFNRRSIEEWEDYVPFNFKLASGLGFFRNDEPPLPVFGSDDVLVDNKLRKKFSQVRKIEDALLLKGSPLRQGWGEWFDKKGDFLRRDRMFKSSVEVLNPLNNPILQDPDGQGLTALTRGDRIYLKGLLFNEFKQTPFTVKKPLTISESHRGGGDGNNNNNDVVDTRTLDKTDDHHIRMVGKKTDDDGSYYADGKRWGYFPGLDASLSFGNFMDAFFRRGRCNMRVFMVWNSPAWMFGVRMQRGLESLLYHHRDACVVVFSETMHLNFFTEFLKDSYKVAVVMPNLDELLKDTPTHIFASVWHEWKQTKHYSTHYSELIRLASLFKYGGIYLDSDIIVLRPLSVLNNTDTVGLEDSGKLAGGTLNGAVMAFRKHSPFIMECLTEFYASYDDTQLRWNGADLLTRVAKSFLSSKTNLELLLLQPSSVFFPVGRDSISRYFAAPGGEAEKLEQDVIFNKILEGLHWMIKKMEYLMKLLSFRGDLMRRLGEKRICLDNLYSVIQKDKKIERQLKGAMLPNMGFRRCQNKLLRFLSRGRLQGVLSLQILEKVVFLSLPAGIFSMHHYLSLLKHSCFLVLTQPLPMLAVIAFQGTLLHREERQKSLNKMLSSTR